MKIPNKILITSILVIVGLVIFCTKTEATSVGPASCSVSPASVTMGQGGAYDLSVSIDRASVGTNSVYVSAMEFQAGAYSDLGAVVPAGSSSANIKIYTTDTAKVGSGTFKVYCSTGCSKASCPGGGSPDVIGSATISLNITGTDVEVVPTGGGDTGSGSSSCKIPSVSIPPNSSLLIPIYTKKVSSGTLSFSGLSGSNITITPVFSSFKMGPYGAIGREKAEAIVRTGPNFIGGSYSITCDLPDGKYTATASAILPFVTNPSGKIKLSQVEYLNDTMFPKSDCPFAIPGCNGALYGNGIHNPQVMAFTDSVALIGGNTLSTRGNPGNGNKDTARYFSLTDPMNPVRVDSMAGPTIDSSIDAAGDYGAAYSIDSVAYSKDGKYRAVVSSQSQLFVSVNGGKKVIVDRNTNGNVSIVKSGSNYIFLQDQYTINITNPVPMINEVTGEWQDQAPLPSGFPDLGRGSKIVLGDDSYVAVVPNGSTRDSSLKIKLFSLSEKEAIAELVVDKKYYNSGKISFTGGDYIYAVRKEGTGMTLPWLLDVFRIEYSTKKITQIVKGASLPLGSSNSAIAGFDLGSGNLGIINFGSDSNGNGKIRAFLFSDLIAGKVVDVLTNSPVSTRYLDSETMQGRYGIVGPAEGRASSYSKDGIIYVYTTDAFGLDVKVWKFEKDTGSSSSVKTVPPSFPPLTVTVPTGEAGCLGGTVYETSAGKLCVNSSGGVTTTTSYNFNPVAEKKVEFKGPPADSNSGDILKKGSKGEAVKELQRFLNAELGLNLAVDGDMGPATVDAVKRYQLENGLKADGVVGPKTKMMMNASSN
jgi:hypothetical protein